MGAAWRGSQHSIPHKGLAKVVDGLSDRPLDLSPMWSLSNQPIDMNKQREVKPQMRATGLCSAVTFDKGPLKESASYAEAP